MLFMLVEAINLGQDYLVASESLVWGCDFPFVSHESGCLLAARLSSLR